MYRVYACRGHLNLCGADVGPARKMAVVLMSQMKWRLSEVGFIDRPVRWHADNLGREAVSSHQR